MTPLAKELRTRQNIAFLRSMPAFRVQEELPDTMLGLLDRLDAAEERVRRRG